MTSLYVSMSSPLYMGIAIVNRLYTYYDDLTITVWVYKSLRVPELEPEVDPRWNVFRHVSCDG